MNAVLTPPQDDLLLSKRELLAVVFRHKWSMIVIFLGTLATAIFAVYYLITPAYESRAVLIINSSALTEPLRDSPGEDGFEKLAYFHTQRDILTSERIAAEAVKRTGLAQDRVIGRVERLRMWIGDLKRKVGGILDIERWTKPWDPEAAAIAAVHNFVETAALPDSKAIEVTLRTKDPDEAARVLNAIIDAHSDYYYGVIQRSAQGVVEYLQREFDEAAVALQAAEQALLEFKKNDHLNPETVAASGISSFDDAPSFVGIADSNEVQQELKLYILKLEEELRLAQQVENVARRNRVIADLKRRIRLYVDAVNSIPDRQLELIRLQRQFDIHNDNYNLIQRNLAKARIVAGGQTEKINLIEVFQRAQASDSPVFPKKRLVVILAAFLGTVLAVTWAFVIDYLDHTVRNPRDIEQFTGLRLLASMERI